MRSQVLSDGTDMTIAELLKVVEAGMKMARKILAILPEHQKDPLDDSGPGGKPSVEFTPGVAEGVAKLNIYRDNHAPPGKPDFTTLIRPRGKTQPVSVTGLGDVRGGVVMGLAGLTCVTDLPPVEKHESVSVDVNGSVMVVGISVSELAGKAHRQRLTVVRDLLSGIATEIRILGLQRALLQPEQGKTKAKKKKKSKKRPDPLQVATDVGLYGPPNGSKQYQNSSDAFKAQYQREQSVPRQSKGRDNPRAAEAVPEVDPVQASRRLALSSALILRDGLALALSTALDLSSWPFPGEAPPTPAKAASLVDVAKVAAETGGGASGSSGVGVGREGSGAVDATQELYMSMHGQTTRASSEANYAYFGGEEEAVEAAAYVRSTPATSESEPVIVLSPAPAPSQRYRVVLGTSEKADKAVEGEEQCGDGEGDAHESFLDRIKRKKSGRATSTKFGSQSKYLYGQPVADDGEAPRGRGPWNTEAGIGAGIAAGSGGTAPKRASLATSSSAPTIPSILHLLPTPVLTAQQAEKDAAEVMRRVKAGGATGSKVSKKARPKSARARPSGPTGEGSRSKPRRPQSARGRSKSPILANASGISPSRSGHPRGHGGDSVMAMFAAGLGGVADTKTKAKTRPGSVSPTSRPVFKSAVPTGRRVESPSKQSWRQREEEEEREHDSQARRKALQLLSLQKKGADDAARRSKLEADIASKARRINKMNDQVMKERASAGRNTFGHGDRFKTDAEAKDAQRVARERYLLEEREAAEEARWRRTHEG